MSKETTNTPVQGMGTSNSVQQSAVVVKARPPVKVTFRFFPADATQALADQALKDESSDLGGVWIVAGKVQGGAFTPLPKGVTRLQRSEYVVLREKNGVQQVVPKAEAALFTALWEVANGQNNSASARAKASADMAKDYPGMHRVKVTVAELPERIAPGTTVGLCWGVDSKAKHRKFPLWQVKAGDNDIMVDVFETYDRHALDDKASELGAIDLGTQDAPKPIDWYTAKLTGAIWLRSTHPFTEADVDALPKEAASDEARKALKRIYAASFDVEKNGDFLVEVATHAPGDPKRAVAQLHWILAENGNCMRNIANLNVQKEVPRRIHPAAYAAVAMAAQQAGVKRVSFTNSWRPMLGSSPHRMGLGLDIKWLDGEGGRLQLNRNTLDKGKLTDLDKDGVVDGTSISVEEQKAFNEWKSAQSSSAAADKAVKAAKKTSAAATEALTIARNKGNADAIERAQEVADEAKKALGEAAEAVKIANETQGKAREAWEKKLGEHEPSTVGNYRRYVMKQPCIRQVIDPWYVVMNQKENEKPIPNSQSDATQRQHNNHMHLTISDAELE